MKQNIYYSNVCHTCKTILQPLKTCASCKAISYCSREHQVKDWPDHKAICKVIKETRVNFPPGTNLSWEEWVRYRTQIRFLWEKMIGRKLHLHENQMWMFQKVCALCYSNDVTINCTVCLNASYCSIDHQKKHLELHKPFCDELKRCMEIDQYLFLNNYVPSVKFIKVAEHTKKLPENMEDLLKLVEIKLYPPSENKTIEFIRSADILAPVATLLFSLEKIFFIESRQIKGDNLTIHLVGAGMLETNLDWLVYIEFICHWIRSLKKLKIMLIGPEAMSHSVDSFDLCIACKERGILASLECFTDLYHNIVSELPQPDCLLLYNPGLHEFENTDNDSWEDSLPSLLNHEVPLVMTSYTYDEMMRDLNKLQKFVGVKVILGPEKNPFKCCRPYRDWETYNQPIFYDNVWLSVIKK